MPVWNPYAGKGTPIRNEDGTQSYPIIGCYVMTTEEGLEVLRKRGSFK